MPDLFPVSEAHDAGGKRRVRWPADSLVNASFNGPNGCYRYWLTETWISERPRVMWLMMNPSVADMRFSDPTIAKTGRFTRRWVSKDGGRYGGQTVCNVHAYRATDKMQLLKVADPVGPENDAWITITAAHSEIIVLAYGQPPKPLRPRGLLLEQRLIDAGHDVRVLALSRDGTPCHPLYQPEDYPPVTRHFLENPF